MTDIPNIVVTDPKSIYISIGSFITTMTNLGFLLKIWLGIKNNNGNGNGNSEKIKNIEEDIKEIKKDVRETLLSNIEINAYMKSIKESKKSIEEKYKEIEKDLKDLNLDHATNMGICRGMKLRLNNNEINGGE